MKTGLQEKVASAARAESAGYARLARAAALAIAGLAAAAVLLLR